MSLWTHIYYWWWKHFFGLYSDSHAQYIFIDQIKLNHGNRHSILPKSWFCFGSCVTVLVLLPLLLVKGSHFIYNRLFIYYYKIERIQTNHITVKIMTLIGRNKSSHSSGWEKVQAKKRCVCACRIVWAKNKKQINGYTAVCIVIYLQHITLCDLTPFAILVP